MATAEIEVKDFSFNYGEAEILKGISFEAYAGEFISIIGPNGAGKTTLIKCLNRVIEGGKGGIVVRGKEIVQYGQKELACLVAYVPQSHPEDIPFSVKELVMHGRYPYLSPFSTISKEDTEVVEAVIERVGLSHLKNRMHNNLSGGEKQKTFVAAALAQQAPIMLLDEPTVYLDPRHQMEVYRLLEDINGSDGITIISVTHDINLAALYSSRIMALKKGELLNDCHPDRIMEPEVLKSIFDADFVFTEHPETKTSMALPVKS